MAGSGWSRWTTRLVHAVERQIDETRGRGGRREPRQVVPYRGFGTRNEVFLTGRVLANAAARTVSAGDAWWRNLAHMFQHLESDEVPGARVRVRVAGHAVEAVTDEEGYYRAWIEDAALPGDRLWHDAHVETVGADGRAGVRATGRVLVPTSHAEYGVISDLDDTVIRTEATRLLRMLKRTLLENAYTRLPFPGVAEFYAGLHAGASGGASNPIFYVSSSPWNLYPVLTEFLDHQSVPAGPLMLRDWGVSDRGILPTSHGDHKLGAIRQILDAYSALPFILIGDSGQQDPEIYRDVVHEYGGRILAVYIRDVSASPVRAGAIGELAEEVRSAGSELLLSDDTLAGARHAAQRGRVREETVAAVAAAVSSSGARPG
jgi:phosphatidate phosphatase APP1